MSNITHPSNSTNTTNPLVQQFSVIQQANSNKFIRIYVQNQIVNNFLLPMAQPLRRMPLALLPKLDEALDRMVDTGVFNQINAAD